MDSGYKFIYTDEEFQILDESDYFAFLENYKQTAAFKTKEAVLDYLHYRKGWIVIKP